MSRNSPKGVILTEGGEGVGWGHINRCQAISLALRESNVDAEFLVDFKGELPDEPFFKVSEWFQMDIKDYDFIIIDSYLADERYYRKLSENNKVIAAIDDNHRIEYPQGIIINGLIGGIEADYSLQKMNYLVGEKFIPLRNPFWTNLKKSINNQINNVLITFGGADPHGLTLKTLEILRKKNCAKHVVIGPSFQNKDILQKKYNENTFYYNSLSAQEMKELMYKSDISISAAGQTTYELAATGTPSIFIGVADNQKTNIKNWVKSGFVRRNIWFNEHNLQEQIIHDFDELQDKSVREILSSLGQQLVDGGGATRISEYILNSIKNKEET